MKHSDFFEKKYHGTPDFPLEYYYIHEKHPKYIMQAHWHNEFEIIRVIKGEFNVFLNNVEYSLSQGDILLVECGCIHRGVPKNSIYECVVFNLNMLINQQHSVIKKYINPLTELTVGVNCLVNKNDSGIYSAINSLFIALREKRPFYELDVYSLLYRLFSQLYAQDNIIPSAKSPHTHQAQTVSRILDWIDKHFTENITLEKLAYTVGLSEKYLCRIFKEYTAKTIISYINELRIENACHEIAVKGKSITAAALDSGFNDLSYFSKIFKRYKGISPYKYKKGYTINQSTVTDFVG